MPRPHSYDGFASSAYLSFARLFATLARVTTPISPLPETTYANFTAPEAALTATDPDNPPWGVGLAFAVWLASVALMFAMPLLAVIPYVFYKYSTSDLQQLDQLLLKDPNFLLVTIAATIPAHLATFAIVWAVVTGVRRRPFWPTIGWGWSPKFGVWKSIAAAIALLGSAAVIAQLLGVNKTPFDEMLESSTAALFATAFLATATAPLIEELVYRGVLYSALKRTTGAVWAVVVVTLLFASVHFWQYQTSPGTIGAIVLLSFGLTIVRATTGRVLPCVVIHLVFNGLQVSYLIFRFFKPVMPAVEPTSGLIALAYFSLSFIV